MHFGRGFNQDIFESGHAQSPLYPVPPFGAGANMAFHREVLVDIGGFHVALGAGTPTMAAEDVFAFTRTLLAQRTLVYQPTAMVFHYHRDTLVDLRRQVHGHGVGVAAFCAALISSDPKLLLALLRFVPAGIKDLRGNESLQTTTMRSLPMDLLRKEWLRGLLKGVPAYVRSAMKQRGMSRPPTLGNSTHYHSWEMDYNR
jgi:hypothetical protein